MAIVRRKIKSGIIYQVKVRDNLGQWYETKSFKCDKEAQRYERHLKSLKDVGTEATPSQIRNITLNDYWEVWALSCRNNCSDGWRQSQEEMWRKHIQPYLGQKRLLEFRTHHLPELFMQLDQNGLGKQTQQLVYKLLHKMFEDACGGFFDPPLIPKNPILKKYKPRAVTKDRPYLTPSESKVLLGASKDHFLGPAIWLGLLCGMRSEAIQALKVSSVDFVSKQILICAGYKRKVKRIDPFPKGKRSEYVPIPNVLIEYLKPLLKDKSPDDFVAPGMKGDMLDYRVFLDGLRKLCKGNNLPVISCHGLRHSTSEMWIEAGATEIDIGRILNHRNGSTTRRYMHRSDERLNRLAQIVGRNAEIIAAT